MTDAGTLAGMSPISTAALEFIRVLVVGKGKSTKDVGKAAGVCEVTIRNAYKVI